MSVRIEKSSPALPEAAALIAALSATLAAITGDSGISSFDPRDVSVAGSGFLLARDSDGVAVGCGAYRPLAPGIAEIKRMYARPGTRGVGAALLQHLEEAARVDGYRLVRLETRRVNERAVAFYRGHGYRPVDNYGPYVGRPEAICFEKPIAPDEVLASTSDTAETRPGTV